MTPELAPGCFHGEKLRSLDVAGIPLSEWAYQPEVQFARHAHAWPYVNLVLQGAYTKIGPKESQTYLPLTLAFHPAGELHADRVHHQGGRIFDLVLEPPWLERMGQYRLHYDGPATFRGGLALWLVLRLYNEFLRPDDVSPLAIEGLVLELMAEVLRTRLVTEQRPPPRWLRQARELLYSRFAETLALAEIARAVGVHPDHLTHTFRRQYGCTVGDYIRRLRVEYACRQLATSDIPLVEIALAAGFADQSHFTRSFKRQIGMTPAEFARHFRLQRFETTE